MSKSSEFLADEVFAEKAEAETNTKSTAVKVSSRVDSNVVERMMSELSEDQKIAVTVNSGNTLLLAPAGTGKTRVMTTRYAHLVKEGTPIERIMMCTFTNSAAAELIARIKEAVITETDDLWVGTTHSIGLKIIRYHAREMGFSNVDSILDREQQEEIVKRVMEISSHPMADSPNETNTIKRILEFIENAKNNMKSPQNAMTDLENGDMSWARGISYEDVIVYEAYENWKMNYDMIDYNDMLYLPTDLIETNPDIRDKWQDMFAHVMVDEYQDLSRSQIRLLKNIIGNNSKTSFYAAADDDQSIYGWRGSDVQATIEFQRYWSNPQIVHIKDNYRTPRNIFSKASSLIRHNKDRHAKSINTREDPSSLIRVINRNDETEEKRAVMENIVEMSQKYSIPFEKTAILCRSNRECQQYATFLAANDIPINLHESIRLSAEPIKALVAWMQLSTAADNPLMYEQIATYPERYLAESSFIDHAARLQKRRARNKDGKKIGPIEFLLEMNEAGKTKSGSKELSELIKEVRDFISKNKSNPFASLSNFLGIDKKVSESTKTEDHQLPSFLRLADEMVEQIGLAKTLSSLTQLDLNAGQEGVNIATMHGAKGLEFEIVALPGWEEGSFPSKRRTTEAEISEERRLAYVAITRAKRMLIVSWSGHNGRSRRPSPFLIEAGIVAE